MTTTRRLAAILAADVAGYSRLMAVDEAGTLARLKLMRADHFEPAIRAHGGRLVGEAGDSLLVEFASASAAVTCAAEVQAKLATLNAELPEDRRMRFRMGVNLGDVIADGATVHGNGVNVAARLEKLAEPGGVLIARVVHDQVKGKVPLAFEDRGDKPLHNIAEPVRVFRLALGSPRRSGTTTTNPGRDHGTTVAVLPFTNMSGDPEQEYFADGITEDLITALAKSRHLAVVARNSTFTFKGRSVKVQDAGRELGARFVIEGSVRKSSGRVRVTAQLIDAETGAHLWAERFDRELADIFTVQDEIVAAISAQLGHRLVDAVALHKRDVSESSLTAYDHFLRGRSAWYRGDPIETRDHYLKAIEADPRHAPSLAGLAFLYGEDHAMQAFGVPVKEETSIARRYAERALAVNDGDPMTHHMLGSVFMDLGDHEKAVHHLELARSLNPYFPTSTINLGYALAMMGRHAEGLAMVERAFWLEPRLAPATLGVPLDIHYMMRDYDSAIADFQRIDDPYPYIFLTLAACYAQADRHEDARRAVADFRTRRPGGYDIAGFVQYSCDMCKLPEDRDHWREGFRKAGIEV
jgi:TolB-like protein